MDNGAQFPCQRLLLLNLSLLRPRLSPQSVGTLVRELQARREGGSFVALRPTAQTPEVREQSRILRQDGQEQHVDINVLLSDSGLEQVGKDRHSGHGRGGGGLGVCSWHWSGCCWWGGQAPCRGPCREWAGQVATMLQESCHLGGFSKEIQLVIPHIDIHPISMLGFTQVFGNALHHQEGHGLGADGWGRPTTAVVSCKATNLLHCDISEPARQTNPMSRHKNSPGQCDNFWRNVRGLFLC